MKDWEVARLARHFLTEPALAEVRGDLPRWRQFLEQRGVWNVPPSPVVREASGARAVDLIASQISQASMKSLTGSALRRAKRTAHTLADALPVRPSKGRAVTQV
jgi:hypothetical protein